MRVLTSVYGAHAHVQPMIPLAQALDAAGHEVRFACQLRMAPLAESAGLVPAPVFEDAQFPITAGELAAKSQRGIDTLLRYTQNWRPDLVVREWSELGGLMVAVEHGLPCAVCGIKLRPAAQRASEHPCLSLMETVFSEMEGGQNGSCLDVVRLMGRQAKRGVAGLDLSRLFGDLWLSFYPPGLALPGTPRLGREHYFRPPLHDTLAGEPVPEWLADLGPEPLVFVTMGTSVNQAGVFEQVVAATAEVAAQVVVTVGSDRDPGSLGPLPANVRVARYIPYSRIMPRAVAAVIHGGFNTVLAALANGVPVICVPVNGDQPVNADRCAQLGVGLSYPTPEPGGLTLDGPDIDPDRLGTLLATVLAEPSFTTAARKVAAEIDALPPVAAAVPLLEELVAG